MSVVSGACLATRLLSGLCRTIVVESMESSLNLKNLQNVNGQSTKWAAQPSSMEFQFQEGNWWLVQPVGPFMVNRSNSVKALQVYTSSVLHLASERIIFL